MCCGPAAAWEEPFGFDLRAARDMFSNRCLTHRAGSGLAGQRGNMHYPQGGGCALCRDRGKPGFWPTLRKRNYNFLRNQTFIQLAEFNRLIPE